MTTGSFTGVSSIGLEVPTGGPTVSVSSDLTSGTSASSSLLLGVWNSASKDIPLLMFEETLQEANSSGLVTSNSPFSSVQGWTLISGTWMGGGGMGGGTGLSSSDCVDSLLEVSEDSEDDSDEDVDVLLLPTMGLSSS